MTSKTPTNPSSGDLEKRLHQKITNIIAKGVSEYRPEGKPIEEITTQILTAIKDAKEWNLNLNTFELDGKPLMTGAEWYARFEKELLAIKTHSSDTGIISSELISHAALEAAKRAAGIDEL